ncbi:MAG: Ribosomal large subunit pseudouridine synthase, partial [Myxococcaceae bacterium]|nr:Ribosomal large subunit pseudouridine synthase [Myxococcaceae bacterium]
QRVALELHRAERSNQLLRQFHDAYVVKNARGEQRGLRALFAPDEPPGGAGDCAAPRLFGQAWREQLRPIALAEFWWGAPPVSGGRHPGAYYPACRGKCGVVLPFMLEGANVEPAPLFGADSAALAEPRVVFEDEWVIVVEKPAGLLSVPGRHEKLRDSVLARLGDRLAEPQVVHRLDLDVSGLMLVAKDRPTHAALQRQFAMRQIDKRYVAWLEGAVEKDEGRVELALRVDPHDRPRQIYDPEHGKSALTEWRVLERTPTRTRVALFPRTGRTHQLRVHAAHPLGIGAPIVGDRLYGREDARLLLHAEALTFTHPRTGERLALRCPAPF